MDDRNCGLSANGTYTNSTASSAFISIAGALISRPERCLQLYLRGGSQPREKLQLPVQRRHGCGLQWSSSGRRTFGDSVETQKPPKTTRRAGDAPPKASAPGKAGRNQHPERLEKSGRWPQPALSKAPEPVINNLIITNNLNLQASGRVLLTTPSKPSQSSRTSSSAVGARRPAGKRRVWPWCSDELAHTRWTPPTPIFLLDRYAGERTC